MWEQVILWHHKLRMIHGRELTETELEKPIPVLIISEALFKNYMIHGKMIYI